MSPELEKKLYYDGIQLFNEHEYFDAHEVWEDIWHMAYGIKHDFYQGLIQCAVALEHYRRGNARGVRSLYKSYQEKFKNIPQSFMGLDVVAFLQGMDVTLRPVVDSDSLPEKIHLDLNTAPTISLSYDPFETGEVLKYNRPDKF